MDPRHNISKRDCTISSLSKKGSFIFILVFTTIVTHHHHNKQLPMILQQQKQYSGQDVLIHLHAITAKTRVISGSCKDIFVAGKSEEKSLSSSNSSKKTQKNEKKPREEYSKKTQTSLKTLWNLCYHYRKNEKYPKSLNWKLYMQQLSSKSKWKGY